MPVNRPISALLAATMTLGLMAVPSLADPLPRERSPIEFRLVHPETRPTPETDIWEAADPAALLEMQQGLLEIRSRPSEADPRQAFAAALGRGITMLPVIGQFANHDWLKGLLVLGTGAGLAAGIYLGQERDAPELVRLGSLGLYPLVVFSMADAIGTSKHREKTTSPVPKP